MDESKNYIIAAIISMQSFAATLWGRWDEAMALLVLCMAVDYVSGLVLAGVYKKSPKTLTGGLNSKICIVGLTKKVMILSFVAIAYHVDRMIMTAYIRNAVIIGFTFNEVLSITENAGLMGLSRPKAVMNMLDLLRQKAGEENKKAEDSGDSSEDNE